MGKAKKITIKIIDLIIDKLVSRLVMIFLFTIVILSLADVFNRFFFHGSIPWAIAFNKYLFVWIVFLGISLGIKRREHFKITEFLEILPTNVRKIINASYYLLAITFFTTLLFTSAQLETVIGARTDLATGIPSLYLYWAIPAGSLLAILALIRNFLDNGL